MSSPAASAPLVYKQRYEQLTVPLADGRSPTVSVKKYVNKGIPKFYNPAPRAAFFAQLEKTGVDIDLHIDAGDGAKVVDKAVLPNIRLFAAYVFAGKGAPEHCQIVLQLADHWNLAPRGLQAYADDALGLDCNGFVGNYLWHVVDERPWSSMGEKDRDGPDTGISGYFDKRHKIRRWDQIKPGRCYILGRTDAVGNVIDKVAGTDSAHIAITEPSLFRNRIFGEPKDWNYPTLDDSPLSWGFRPNHLRTSPSAGPLSREGAQLGDPSFEAIFVVESTASAQPPGLSASWYRLKDVNSKGHIGLFELYRESMTAHQRLWFQIAEVG